jgi:hypothetical protein
VRYLIAFILGVLAAASLAGCGPGYENVDESGGYYEEEP